MEYQNKFGLCFGSWTFDSDFEDGKEQEYSTSHYIGWNIVWSTIT